MSRNEARRALALEQLEARETPAAIGSLDPSFNGTGLNAYNTGLTERFNAVAAQPDGKLVAVGTLDNDFLMVRYNPDGTLDGSFNANTGVVRLTLATDELFAVAVQPDGKIVAVGGLDQGDGGDFIIFRRKADGTSDGPPTAKNLGGADVARGLAFQTDGKIVVTGTASSTNNFALVRFNADLSYDAGFGIQSADFGGTDQSYGVAVYQSGPNQNQILVVGQTSVNSDFAIARFGANGGVLTSSSPTFGGDDRGRGVAILPDNRAVVVGLSDSNVAALRLADADLNLDSTFSPGGTPGDGLGTYDLGGLDEGNTVALQPDGRAVVGGKRNSLPVVLRLTSDGQLDTIFNGTGQVSLGATTTGISPVGVAVLPNGRIAAATSSTGGTNGLIGRIIGTVEDSRALGVSGIPTGTASLFTPLANGQYFASVVANVTPFAGFTGNVRSATGDVNGDGFEDTVVVSGPGAQTRFTVISGRDNATPLVGLTDPFGDVNFTGGAFVAVADLDNDGRAEMVFSPDQGGGPRVVVISLLDGVAGLRGNFFGIDDPAFRGGARVGLGDINGDGYQDLAVAAGFLGGPRVALFDGKTVFGTPTRLISDFFVFPGTDAVTLRNGVFVAVGDTDGDGKADLIAGGGPGGGPRVFILSGAKLAANDVAGAQGVPLANYFVATNNTDRGGVRVAAKDVDGDAKSDVATGTGEGSVSRVRVYFGKNFGAVNEPIGFQDLDPYSSAVVAAGVFVG